MHIKTIPDHTNMINFWNIYCEKYVLVYWCTLNARVHGPHILFLYWVVIKVFEIQVINNSFEEFSFIGENCLLEICCEERKDIWISPGFPENFLVNAFHQIWQRKWLRICNTTHFLITFFSHRHIFSFVILRLIRIML